MGATSRRGGAGPRHGDIGFGQAEPTPLPIRRKQPDWKARGGCDILGGKVKTTDAEIVRANRNGAGFMFTPRGFGPPEGGKDKSAALTITSPPFYPPTPRGGGLITILGKQ